MRRALAIAAKDLRLRIRDRSAFIIGLLVPFGLAGIFSLTLANADEGGFTATYAVVDADGGEVAAGFDALIRSLDFVTLKDASSADQAARLAEDGDVDAAFVIPPGFSAAATAGRGGEIRVITDPQSEIGGLVARSLARSFASDLDAVQLSVATAIASGASAQDAAALAERAHAVPAAAVLDRTTTESRSLSSKTFFAIGMAVFFVFFTVEFGVRSLLDEREQGTLARLLVAPLQPSWVVGGKVGAGFVVGIVSMGTLVIATSALLGASWGSPAGVLLMMLASVSAAVAVTALVATLAKTPQQAAGYTSLVTVVLGLFGGTFFPISQASFLSSLSLVAPQAWMMRGYQDLASGGAVGRRPAVARGAAPHHGRRRRPGRLPRPEAHPPVKALAIAWSNLRRVFRDRIGAFFILVFPFLIILAIGAVFGSGFTPVVGVVSRGSGALGADLARRLERTEDIDIQAFDDREELATAVERGHVDAGLVIVPGFDARVRGGETVALPFFARPSGGSAQVGLTVDAVIAEQSAAIRAARLAASEDLASFDEALQRARRLRTTLPRVVVRETVAGGAQAEGGFDYGAAQELVLFVFVISLSASSMLIETRRLGISRRMLASPTSSGQILVGESLGRLAIALFEGLLIFVVTLVVFGVDWGDPVGGIAVIVLFALVGTGAAMLMGSSLHNAEQAGALGVFIGLGFAALGGCMVPLEVFPPAMVTIAHLTPHAWALDAFDEIVRKGGTIGDVLPELGVLAAYATVLLAAATLVFRRRLTEPEGST